MVRTKLIENNTIPTKATSIFFFFLSGKSEEGKEGIIAADFS